MAKDFTTSLIKLNNQYTIIGSVQEVNDDTVPKKGELYFDKVVDGERICKIGDGITALRNLPTVGVSSLGLIGTTEAADVNLNYNAKYKLNVGGKDIVFKMPPAIEVEEFEDTFQEASYTSGLKIATGHNTPDLYVPTGTTSSTVAIGNHGHTITASATDGIFNLTGTSATNKVTYAVAPYTSRQSSAGKFDTSTTNPTGTTRLNWDGYLYATKFFGDVSGNASSATQLQFVKKLDTADNLDTLTTPGLYWWGNGTNAPTNNGANTLPFTSASVVEVSPIMNPDGTQYGVTQRMWRYGSSGYVAQRTIYGNTVLDWFTFATTAHSHDISIASSTATNELTLAHGSKYALSVGGQSFVFTMPSSGNTDYKASSYNTSSKIYLIGATSQGSFTTSGQTTYSHDTAYVGTDGCLYSNSTKVSVEGHTHNTSNITALTSYSKPSASSALSTSDSLNTALGKLEKALDGKAITNHASLTTEYGVASTASYGHAKLSSSVSSTSEELAATPKAVKTAYDLAAAALPKTGGTLTGSITFSSGTITCKTGLYYTNGDYAMNLNNSDIIGLNALYFKDAADSTSEGINFFRSDTNYDRLWGAGGVLYWTPNENRTSSTEGTKYKVMTAQHFSLSGTTLTITL